MLFTSTTFIGIDPTAGQRPFTYAALDGDLSLLALGQGGLEDVLAFAAGQRQAAVAVCAPRRPNLGLMAEDELRQAFPNPPRPGRWNNGRVADYLLRQHNIVLPAAPADPADAPNWMRMGFTLHRRLEGLGYQPYPPPDEPAATETPSPARLSLEVYPHAAYTALLGQAPFPKATLEGRLQRQLVLYDLKLRLPDPMNYFEEITRFKLLHGILPAEGLYQPGELDALMAAYTAWLLARKPEQVTTLGDAREGVVVIPCEKLKEKYPRAAGE
jgi:hypothetical protein